MQGAVLVFVGGGIGAVLRYGVTLGVLKFAGPAFPWHTLLINVAGSLVMGLFAGWLTLKAGAGWSEPSRLFLMTGICGGFTTFSAFSLDAVTLWMRGEAGAAAAYVAASVILSILGLVAGLAIVRSLT